MTYRLQAFAQLNEGYKFEMGPNYKGVVITDAIKFVQTNKEKITIMSTKEENSGKESRVPDCDDDKDQLERKQEEEAGELSKQVTTNQVF